MNLEELEQKLIAAARCHPPPDTVPYGFEQRIMSRLREQGGVDPLNQWAAALWRAALTSVALLMVAGVLAQIRRPAASPTRAELPQVMEYTLFADLNHNLSDPW